ncbi:MAG: peptidase C25, partial [Bacteroidales bacterium]|nr:peptidase C25 [Bacteroidales bacterium]
MKRAFLSFLLLVFAVSVTAQQTIQLRSANRAECVKSDMKSLKATFSFSGIEASELKNDRGTFSTITMPNTVMGGNVGEPQIPVVNKLIAVPLGATPNIRVTHYSSTDYNLKDYGIHKLTPRQPNVEKDQKPEFVYNEEAYQKRGLSSEPTVRASINGTLRGVQVGQFSIEPVSYDPASNTLRVFNNIEVEISFDGADARATEDMLVNTYSPYFDVLYKQLFNGRSVRDLYEDHPELWRA